VVQARSQELEARSSPLNLVLPASFSGESSS
jgi:hypothetical protein